MDPIAPPVRELLALFADELAEVKFPDMDAGVLAAAASSVHGASDAVAIAEAAVERARAALVDAQEHLLACAHRALAYGRVFAANDAELSPRLAALTLPRARGKAPAPRELGAPRRRGRPPKVREAAAAGVAD